MPKIRTYSELIRFKTFDERYEYLSLKGEVGQVTFGFDRWINQHFYQSREWKRVRRDVIIRDRGCDLGVPGYEVFLELMVHHMNPLSPKSIELGESWILDPEYLITVSHLTHNAIHYGDKRLLPRGPVERRPGDTKIW
jgi:hypothetical protein